MLGVSISVATIPAEAEIGVSCAFAGWAEARGSLLQLLLNIGILIAVGTAARKCQRAIWRRVRKRQDEHAAYRTPPG